MVWYANAHQVCWRVVWLQKIYLYRCKHIYFICICVCICIHIMYKYIHVYTYSTYAYVHIHRYIQVCGFCGSRRSERNLYICVCTWIHTYVHIDITCIYICVWFCIFMFIFMKVCTYIYIWNAYINRCGSAAPDVGRQYVYVCVYMCIYVYTYIYK